MSSLQCPLPCTFKEENDEQGQDDEIVSFLSKSNNGDNGIMYHFTDNELSIFKVEY